MDRHDSSAETDDAAAAALGRAWTDDSAWEFLTRLTSIGNRMGGSDGERRAAELVAEAFRDAGVGDVRERPFEMRAWNRGRSALRLTAPDERQFDAVALPYSPSGEVTGELEDVGHGTPAEVDEADVDGKIAVASTTTPSGGRFVHRMEKFGYAVDAGAEAFVFVNHVPGQLPPTGALKFGEEAVAPAVGVSKESGAWLTDYAARDGTATLTVEAETVAGESRNVVGRLGPDTDEELLLVAHYDAHDIAEGALDNGCGIATVVVAAEILAAMDLPLGVRVAAVGCEETGLTGAERLAAELDHDRLKAVVNVDGAGRFRDLVAMTHDSDATERVARRVADRTRHPIRVRPEPHPFSDQWPFVRAGIPALQLHSDSGERGRGWGHTHADTRDKVDDRNVREHAMLAAILVRELASESEVPRLDEDALAAAFRAEEFETGMRAAGLWPDEWT
ncbi:Zn-dependent amino-or carboxypeptidase, M28 family [Halopelagius inordinatus]|uniref:Carboxypeptidase Q n=1 Tax=Halopelagius inordinatus TaxID=553467 RepID=A0A1I2TNM2_9EURY|nr:M28 family metallopeptidase [Halopelagius inordinatus]SFG63931.1 Zn-dependent amino-or carboxypeptidase, M28 family [Halopelagius inordinatus]